MSLSLTYTGLHYRTLTSKTSVFVTVHTPVQHTGTI